MHRPSNRSHLGERDEYALALIRSRRAGTWRNGSHCRITREGRQLSDETSHAAVADRQQAPVQMSSHGSSRIASLRPGDNRCWSSTGPVAAASSPRRLLPRRHRTDIRSICRSHRPSWCCRRRRPKCRSISHATSCRSGMVGEQPMVIAVNPALGINTLAELIARAKGRPGEILFGAARGTLPHLMGEMLRGRVGLDLAYIPSAGARAMQDAIGGTIHVFIEEHGCRVGSDPRRLSQGARGCLIEPAAGFSRPPDGRGSSSGYRAFRGAGLVCLDGARPNAGRHRAKGQSRPAQRSSASQR